MTHTDDVMEELWLAKRTLVKRHKNIAGYFAHLRKLDKLDHPGGRIPAPTPPIVVGRLGRPR